jgi:hypothetical protein
MPEKVNNRYETSAYGCDEMDSADIWDLNERKDKEPKGRAEFSRTMIETLDKDKIRFEPNGLPSHHGNVIGWPEADDERDARMQIAKDWAEKSEFIRYSKS